MFFLLKSARSVRAALFGLLVGAALPIASPLRAQTAQTATLAAPAGVASLSPPAPASAPKPARFTLREVLSKTSFGDGIALAIDQPQQRIKGEDLEKNGADTVVRAATTFGKLTHWFGGVMAIGPQTYTELTTDFTGANAFADMPQQQAFTLLLSGLDDGQRTAMAGKSGLGFSDLITPLQRHLFEVLLPEAEVSLQPRSGSDGGESKYLGNLRANASSVHFRVAQEVELLCEVKNQPYGSINATQPDQIQGQKIYRMDSWRYNVLDRMNGVTLRREVPNRLKRSDLNYDSPRLQIAIPIKDLQTVGDLIGRIAKQTGIELIAGTLYEKKGLIWVSGGRTSASASEILRALAFSLAGTYRRVGTAFVLTEDLQGVETRRQLIRDFEEDCDAERAQAIKDAEKALKENPAHKKLKLNSFGDPLAMTAEEEKAPAPNPNYHQGLAETALPFDKLSDAQQDAITHFQEQTKAHPEQYSPEWAPDFSKPIHVVRNSAVQMLINGVDGVVVTDFGGSLTELFKPEEKKSGPTAEDLKMFDNMPKWADAAKGYSRRAVVCHPHSKADVDASLTRIAAQKFNQMWMVVFENGKARIPGTPFPIDPAFDPKTDLLAYAIEQGAKQGITICPVVNTYAWGASVPAALRLRTLRGEDSAQSAVRRLRINTAKPPRGMEEFNPMPKGAGPSPDVYVDLTDSTVQTALAGLFRALTARAGAGNIVCRAIKPDGFANQSDWQPMRLRDEMGYNTSLRLAFLRKNHCDPVDLRGSLSSDTTFRANTALTNYEGEYNESDALKQKWNALRFDALKDAWRLLYETIWNGAGDKKPALLLAQDDGMGFISWYDDWSDPKAALPSASLYSASPDTAAKPGETPKLTNSVLFLSKQAPSALPIEMAKYNWMDFQMKVMDFYKQFRHWDGIAIEE